MLMTISGKDFFKSDDRISAIHFSPDREKNAMPSDAFEIWYAAYGSGIFCYEEQEITVNESDIFLVAPNSNHCFMSIQDPNELALEMYYCKFYPDEIHGAPPNCMNYYDIARAFTFHPDILDHLKSIPYLSLSDTHDKIFRNLFVRLIHEFTSRPVGYSNMMKAYLNELVILLFRKYEETLTGKKTGILENSNPIITNVIKYIQFNLQNELSLDDISNYFYMSSSYLSKLFKKHTGVTIQDYIQTLRIEKACDLLRNTDRTIESIVDRIGYSSNSYFHKIFKSKIGMTMSEYRTKYRDSTR